MNDLPQPNTPLHPLGDGEACPASDPLIDEVRSLRRRASERFGHDLNRLMEHLRAIEAAHPAGVVVPPNRPGVDRRTAG